METDGCCDFLPEPQPASYQGSYNWRNVSISAKKRGENSAPAWGRANDSPICTWRLGRLSPLSLSLSLSFFLHCVSVSVKDLNTTYLKLSLCVTSSNTFWHRMADWGSLLLASVHHLFIQTALLARDAIYPHYSILPLNVTINLQSSTYYMLLYTSNARKILNG